ncbi:unnamed protein product [Enterobius vermicularis]|uniref:Ion_trans_2 domain-containing protein n=1 Tax=Enterobius vermicularis TaxID=51028 RepID=A0A0N4VP56_ENTVE|nr:unnamed protein product [Enterobius vermicularis]
MPVLLKAAIDRSGFQSYSSDARRSVVGIAADQSNAGGHHYLRTLERQNTTASALSHRSGVSVNVDAYKSAQPPAIPQSKTVLQKVKWFYKHCHINYLLPLVFVMLYMFVGAVIFLVLEEGYDEAKKLENYHNYLNERELLIKRMEEILIDLAAERPGRRRIFIEEAVDYFHNQVGFLVTNQTDWSLVTALYYSGTVFTTIG